MRKGLKTIMLERGRDIVHVKDYVNANKEAWDYPHRGRRTQELISEYPVLKGLSAERNHLDYWCSDKDSPYTEIKTFRLVPVDHHVGGRSLMWGRQSYRFSDHDYEANAKDGHGVDWPVRYKEIAPWYDYAEKFAGISGNRDGLDILPDGLYAPHGDELR
jgi:choline dehydrogenase-like flavoprotein